MNSKVLHNKASVGLALDVSVDSPVELSVRPEEQFPPQRTPNTLSIKWEQQYIVYWLIKPSMFTCIHVERVFFFLSFELIMQTWYT
jgi:hypothetical protein